MSISTLSTALAVCAVAFGAALSGAAQAQSALCDDPTGQCSKLIAPDCLQRLGAGSMASDTPAICAAQLEVYQNCLALVAQNCTAAPVNAPRSAAEPNVATPIATGAEEAVDGFSIAVRDCIRDAAGLVCRVIIRNTAPDRAITLYGSQTRSGNVAHRSLLYDASGVSHDPREVLIGGVEIGNFLEWSFPQELGIELRLTFDPTAFEGAAAAPLLRVNFWRRGAGFFSANLRNLPIQ